MYLHGGYSEFTVRGWSRRYPAAYMYIYVYMYIYLYTYIYASRGRSSRWRPAGSVSGRSCSKIEGRRDRKLHPTADQGPPREFPGGQAATESHRNSKFKFKRTRDVPAFLFACDLARLHFLRPPVKLEHRFDLRRGWRADKQTDTYIHECIRVYITYVERIVMYMHLPSSRTLSIGMIWNSNTVSPSNGDGNCNSDSF